MEFSQKIKAKYPGSYDDLDDRVLAQKMVAKFPEYSDVTFDESSSGSKPTYGAKDYVGDIARPFIEAGGAVGGGILGSAAGPIGTATGGALGFAAGKSAADLLDRSLGRSAPIQNLSQAAKETGRNLYEGAKVEAGGQLLGRVAPPVMAGIGKGYKQGVEWATGIPERATQTVAENPSSFWNFKRFDKAGAQFEKAAQAAGVSDEITPELLKRIKPGAGPSNYAFDAYERILKGEKLTPAEALAARQSIDASYPVPNEKNGGYLRLLDKMRKDFQSIITNASPELAAASKEYAIAKSGSRFHRLFPMTKSGRPSYFRTAAVLAGLSEGEPTLAIGIPAVAGGITSLAGPAALFGKRLVQNPAVTRGLVAASPFLSSKPNPEVGLINSGENPAKSINDSGDKQVQNESTKKAGNKAGHDKILLKKLDEATALKYFERANGDAEKARQMALKDGYIIPE